MKALSLEERIQLMKNLLEDPDDYMSFELLALADQYDSEQSENTTSNSDIGKLSKK